MTNIEKNIYIKIRENLREEHRHMAIPQFGGAVIAVNEKGEILLVRKTSNKNLWVVPGGVQELGETLRYTAKREFLEETRIDYPEDELQLVDVLSGEGRHKIYPNGDEVYNNTALYVAVGINSNTEIDISSEDYMDIGGTNYVVTKESSEYGWFDESSIPEDTNDKDMIDVFYKWYKSKSLKRIRK